MVLELDLATQSRVYTDCSPGGGAVFRVRGLEVCLPILATWDLAVRKFRIQAHRGVFRPSSISLPASLLGAMVLKAEVKSINNVKMREGAVYYVGNSIVYGSVCLSGELQRVHGGR